ncbi:hypothetical protein B7494_g3218 [Chlorociboria aeruginascens]|nr:hypothetical protein B7494_g3218 [Chlorociboria aeruginascens]
MITLYVGGANNIEKGEFYIHEEKLVEHKYFAIALQKDTFIEGRTRSINFEEEDPALFSHLVEYIYKGDFNFHCEPSIVRLMAEAPILRYTPDWDAAVVSGAATATPETTEGFNVLTQLLCLGDRYDIDGFMDCVLEKIKSFPIGPEEVTMLAYTVLVSLPTIGHDDALRIFLVEQIRLNLPRLDSFRDSIITETEDTRLKMMDILTEDVSVARASFITNTVNMSLKVAVCIRDVTLEENLAKYGSDDLDSVKLGAAMIGDWFATPGVVNSGLMTARVGHSSIALPADAFQLLRGADFRQNLR